MEVLRENSALQPDLKCEGGLYITWFWGNLIHLMIRASEPEGRASSGY